MRETIGFSGSRAIDSYRDVARITRLVEALPPGTTVVTGGCVGVDAVVARAAHAAGLCVWTVVPDDPSRVDPEWRTYATVEDCMPAGTTYRDRNQWLVELSDRLIAFPAEAEEHPSSRRSGTWQTVRLAHRAGKPVEVVVLGSCSHPPHLAVPVGGGGRGDHPAHRCGDCGQAVRPERPEGSDGIVSFPRP